jgi:Eukaryotic protein of unknown function (DUF846)
VCDDLVEKFRVISVSYLRVSEHFPPNSHGVNDCVAGISSSPVDHLRVRPSLAPTMSHDLHFTVQNGDGSTAIQTDGPITGEMDHLPDNARLQPDRPSSLQYIQEQLKQSAHPMVIIFHIIFKALALVLYMCGRWLIPSGKSGEAGSKFITLTVACILLLAADFWVVKNVTGRLLVGLRWWNKVENETTTWIFESAESQTINAFDRKVFWTVLYATPVIWIFLFGFGLFRMTFSWLIIVIMALALGGANVYGYYKCSTDQKARFQQMMQSGAQQGAMAMISSSMMSILTGSGTSTPANSGGRNFV